MKVQPLLLPSVEKLKISGSKRECWLRDWHPSVQAFRVWVSLCAKHLCYGYNPVVELDRPLFLSEMWLSRSNTTSTLATLMSSSTLEEAAYHQELEEKDKRNKMEDPARDSAKDPAKDHAKDHTKEHAKDHVNHYNVHFEKKLPKDAEASNILVGEV